MGAVRVQAELVSPQGIAVAEEFLVDTGSFYTAISPDVRDRLALPEGMPQQVMLADGRVIDTEVTIARLRLLGREGVVPVEVVSVPEPLLGVSALEALGLKVNPMSRELELDRPYGPPPSFTRFRPQ
jgi:clan AA aspartic protease